MQIDDDDDEEEEEEEEEDVLIVRYCSLYCILLVLIAY